MDPRRGRRCGRARGGQLAGLPLTTRTAGGRVDQSTQKRWEAASAKVEVASPFRRDRNPRHLLIEGADVGLKCGELVAARRLARSREALLRNAVDDLDPCDAAYQQRLGRRPNVVDCEGDVRSLAERFDLRRRGCGADDDICAVPPEPRSG